MTDQPKCVTYGCSNPACFFVESVVLFNDGEKDVLVPYCGTCFDIGDLKFVSFQDGYDRWIAQEVHRS